MILLRLDFSDNAKVAAKTAKLTTQLGTYGLLRGCDSLASFLIGHGGFELDEGTRVLLSLSLHYHAAVGRILRDYLDLHGLCLANVIGQIKDASANELVFTVELELVLITLVLTFTSLREASSQLECSLFL